MFPVDTYKPKDDGIIPEWRTLGHRDNSAIEELQITHLWEAISTLTIHAARDARTEAATEASTDQMNLAGHQTSACKSPKSAQ